MGRPKGYDPTKVKTLVNGVRIVDFGKDSMVKISRSSAMRSMTVGCDGNVTVNKSADFTGKAEITLMANSASNEYLKMLASNDLGFPFLVTDMNSTGDTGATTLFAFVENLPDFERAKEVGEVTWTLLLTDVDLLFTMLNNI